MTTKVSDVMTYDVETIEATATLEEAAQKMRDCNVGALPVYAGKILIGFVTDRDITVKATARGLSPSAWKVEDVMTWRAEWCFESMDVDSAAEIMKAKRVHRLGVFDRWGKLVGILSLSDIATKTHDSSIVEQVVEATASRPVTGRQNDSWETFDEGVVD